MGLGNTLSICTEECPVWHFPIVYKIQTQMTTSGVSSTMKMVILLLHGMDQIMEEFSKEEIFEKNSSFSVVYYCKKTFKEDQK